MPLPPWLEPTNDRSPLQLGPGEDINSRVARWCMSDEEYAEISARTKRTIEEFVRAGCPGVPDAMRNLLFRPDVKA